MRRLEVSKALAKTGKPRRNAIIVAAFVGLLVLAMCWLTILSPRLSAAAEIEAQAENVELANITQQRKLADLTRMAQEAPQAAERVQALLARMPQEADLPDLFAQITKAATSAGIPEESISAITQSVPVPLSDPALAATGPVADALDSATKSNVDVAKVDVTVSVTATDEQVLDFTENLENLERDFLLSSVSVSNPSGQAKGERVSTVTGTTFLLQSTLPDLVANVDDVIERAGLVLEPAN